VEPGALRLRKAARLLTAAGALAFWLASGALAQAQSEDLPPPPPGYAPAVPDVPDSLLDQTRIDHHFFTLRLGIVPILDYTWLTQDQESTDQVGVQDDEFDIRSGRVMARGTIFASSKHASRYLVAFEYKGFDSDPNVTWSFTDISLTFPLGEVGDLTVGKTKEPFVYEMVGDAANLPHVERLLSPFFVSRNWGLRFNRAAAAERMTLAFGVYNDWFTTDPTWDESGTTLAGRVSGLPWMDASGRRFLHVAGAFRRNGADLGTLRFKGRPESNVTDNYVDTGSIPASHATQLGVEALWNEGPFSLTTEYAEAHVDSPETGGPQFRGWYATASWVLTGEHRLYDKKVGYARRVLPRGRWGAFELIARYGLVDLTDKGIDGGYLKKWFAGVNWWATRRIRITAGFGRATLEKLGTTGHTNQYFTRVQWVY
jgi:phosphate-selective porin OprO/OprP